MTLKDKERQGYMSEHELIVPVKDLKQFLKELKEIVRDDSISDEESLLYEENLLYEIDKLSGYGDEE